MLALNLKAVVLFWMSSLLLVRHSLHDSVCVLYWQMKKPTKAVEKLSRKIRFFLLENGKNYKMCVNEIVNKRTDTVLLNSCSFFLETGNLHRHTHPQSYTLTITHTPEELTSSSNRCAVVVKRKTEVKATKHY